MEGQGQKNGRLNFFLFFMNILSEIWDKCKIKISEFKVI